jgi:hypothetical protein
MFSGERRVSEIIINVKGKRLTRATSAAFVMRSTSSMTMKRRALAHESAAVPAPQRASHRDDANNMRGVMR